MEFEDTASAEMQKLIDNRPGPFPGRYVTDDDAFWDEERAHKEAEKILCRELRKLGRGDLVELFDKVAKQDLEHIMEAEWGPSTSAAEIKAPPDRFELEQDIFKCWHIVDDIDQVAELVLDRDASKDTVSNILIGLSALYGDRFQKLMANFEKCSANEND